MASRSHKYILNDTIESDRNIKSSDSKKTALRHSMRINLDPMLALEESLFEHIPVLHIKEGNA